MENVIVSNQKEFNRLKENFRREGLNKIHILADFDKTLTKAFVNGQSVPSIISILRDGNYLTLDYAKKAQGLYDKYHPFEVDLDIEKSEKKKMMEEWWRVHFNLLIKSGLNKKDIEQVIQSPQIQFREGFLEFVDLLKRDNIPLVIISSAGLGKESISLKIEKEGKLYDNIYIISNSFNWDENGDAVSIKEPIIHGANKDETSISASPEAFKAIKTRKNVILIGDSLDDIGMVEGFNYENLIKIGFLNYFENIEIDKYISKYQEIYDIVITKDSSLVFLNYLLKEISIN